MKNKVKLLSIALFSVFLLSNICYSKEVEKVLSVPPSINTQFIAPEFDSANIVDEDIDESVSSQKIQEETFSDEKVSELQTPVKDQQKRLLKPANRKVDLRAIIFDPTVTVKVPENIQEMTAAEAAKYKIKEALHCEVTVPSTKGLLEDTMKMTFERGPIESIAPWIDFSSNFSNIWAGEDYKNTTYGINFNDVGINGKFRTNDDPASGKKTVFRLMYNVGKEVPGNTYLQSFLADNYIMRYWTRDDQILLGYARSAIGIEGGESPFTIPFFGRSQISRTYGNVRSLGVKAQGVHNYYDYSLGFFSSGRFFKDFFPGPEFTGLVSVKPLAFTDGKWGKITAGGSLNAGNAESNYCVGGAHLIYDYKRLKASFEYASADGSNGSTGFTKNQSEGYYGTLAYRVSPRIQALVRYDQFDPNKSKANDIRTEYTAGLNYFVKGQALKLMLNYVYYTVENGAFGSRIMTGAQIIL